MAEYSLPRPFYYSIPRRTPLARVSKRAPTRPPSMLYADGREVLNLSTYEGRCEYGRRLYEMWTRQKHTCCLCFRGLLWIQATFHHTTPRSAGGAFRDDRIWDERGLAKNGAAHKKCNCHQGSRHDFSKFKPSEARNA